MNRLQHKRETHKKRKLRVRKSLASRHARPRLVFNRTNKNLFAQLIDDATGTTLCSASTLEKSFGGSAKNKEAAAKLGQVFAERAKGKGVSKIVFDRRGLLYHGKVASFADAAREGGLEF